MGYFDGDIKKIEEVIAKLSETVALLKHYDPGEIDLAQNKARGKIAEAERLLDKIRI